MKRLFSFFLIMLFASCVDVEEQPNTNIGNFDALWQIVDEHYCFFDYKAEVYGLDWNAVKAKYRQRVSEQMTNDQLFEVCADMLAELRDGHVNLSRSADFARYWSWHEDYPANYSDSLERVYLGKDYRIASGLKYKILDDNIGYIRYESFEDGVGNGNVDEVLNHFILCRAIIIDIRNNTGGNLTNVPIIASHFTDNDVHVGYIQHKRGPGHNDFSPKERQVLKPSSGLRWHKPVYLLTNRSVYSAANEFTKYMKALPNVTIVGDRTGGGAGMPMSSQIPNGWGVRFSACPMYDSEGNHTEFGIEPDIKVDITSEDYARDIDTIIETARQLLQ